MQTSKARARTRTRSERGAGLVEYALLVALIAVVCITAVTFVGTSGSSKFDKAGAGIGGAPAAVPTTLPAGPGGHNNAASCNADPRGYMWIQGACYPNGNG